ncbi:PD-(D/E)XK nuclease family protein [Trebonia sp.]|uniref:PD-(D/E)XK nuclease family protein n=1 Tax=Trebonia sp. TaxID=2767075 RepID=UPI003BAFF2AA
MSETENQIARMSAEWELLLAKSANTRAVPMEWERSIASMQREVNLLRDQGRWLGGYRTLMHALGIQYREVYLTAGLAWLLDPDGWHGLGSKVLSGLLAQLGLPSGIEHPVTVSKEETRSAGETRADLVIRMPGVTLLVEAKVYADEQPGQCDRLADAWAPENPSLVFLTRDGHPPRTAVRSVTRWRRLTWTQVGTIVAAAIQTPDQTPDCAPGVQELLTTIEIFGK